MVHSVKTLSTPDRRGAVADVVIEIVATRGLEAVSVREVAAGLNVSIGAIQHHFSTKAEMMVFAFGASSHARADVSPIDRSQATPPLTSPRPFANSSRSTTRRRIDATVTLAFASLAATNPTLQRIQADLLTTIRGELATRLGPHSDTRAAVLLAVVDGLALHDISAPGSLSPSVITGALDLAIDAALRPDNG